MIVAFRPERPVTRAVRIPPAAMRVALGSPLSRGTTLGATESKEVLDEGRAVGRLQLGLDAT